MKHIKRVGVIAWCFFLAFLFVCTSVYAKSTKKIEAQESEVQIALGGEVLSFSTPIVEINGTIYVPMGEFADKMEKSMGYQIKWQELKDGAYNGVRRENVLVSMAVYASSAATLAYWIDLYADGQLSVYIGRTSWAKNESEAFATKLSVYPTNTEDDTLFVPKFVRHRLLTAEEMEGIVDLLSEITADETDNNQFCVDGWYNSIIYKGNNYRYIFSTGKGWGDQSEHMCEIRLKLLEFSPIDIVAYNYEDPFLNEYYKNRVGAVIYVDVYN